MGQILWNLFLTQPFVFELILLWNQIDVLKRYLVVVYLRSKSPIYERVCKGHWTSGSVFVAIVTVFFPLVSLCSRTYWHKKKKSQFSSLGNLFALSIALFSSSLPCNSTLTSIHNSLLFPNNKFTLWRSVSIAYAMLRKKSKTIFPFFFFFFLFSVTVSSLCLLRDLLPVCFFYLLIFILFIYFFIQHILISYLFYTY